MTQLQVLTRRYILAGYMAMVGILCNAQLPTYTIDTTFNTGELFQGGFGPNHFYVLPDERILIGGSIYNWYVDAYGMVYPDGTLDPGFFTFNGVSPSSDIIAQDDGYVYCSLYGAGKLDLDGYSWTIYHEPWLEYGEGGTNSPYNAQFLVDMYELDNGDLILTGAIATDTLQPNLFRGLTRIHADGSHDPTFPILNINPNHEYYNVRHIEPAPDGSWYISGGFKGINGHETNYIAKLTPNFQVDTTFVSPILYDGFFGPYIISVDDQSRVWLGAIYGMRVQSNPEDTIKIIRLLSNGEVDTTFFPRIVRNEYPPNFIYPILSSIADVQEIEAYPGNYLINGAFNYFNDTLQACITVVNDAGTIQPHFFQGQGPTIDNTQSHANDTMPGVPSIRVVEQLDDGSLLIGGRFTTFMGEPYNYVIKLKPDILDAVPEVAEPARLSVYPNPANTYIEFEYELLMPSEQTTLRIIDMQGKPVHRWNLGRGQRGIKVLDTRELPNGTYVYELIQRGEKLNSGKFIIQH